MRSSAARCKCVRPACASAAGAAPGGGRRARPIRMRRTLLVAQSADCPWRVAASPAPEAVVETDTVHALPSTLVVCAGADSGLPSANR